MKRFFILPGALAFAAVASIASAQSLGHFYTDSACLDFSGDLNDAGNAFTGDVNWTCIPTDAIDPAAIDFGNISAADADAIVAASGGVTAEDVSYDNTGSGATATDVQDALDEAFAAIGADADTDATNELGGLTVAANGTMAYDPTGNAGVAGVDLATQAELDAAIAGLPADPDENVSNELGGLTVDAAGVLAYDPVGNAALAATDMASQAELDALATTVAAIDPDDTTTLGAFGVTRDGSTGELVYNLTFDDGTAINNARIVTGSPFFSDPALTDYAEPGDGALYSQGSVIIDADSDASAAGGEGVILLNNGTIISRSSLAASNTGQVRIVNQAGVDVALFARNGSIFSSSVGTDVAPVQNTVTGFSYRADLGVLQINNDDAVIGTASAPFNVGRSGIAATASPYFATFRQNNVLIGQIRGDGAGGVAFTSLSDERLKEDIKDAEGASDIVQNIRWVWATRRDVEGDEPRLQVLAQQVQEVFPQVVSAGGADDMLSVNYAGLTPLLGAALSEQAATIARLEARIEALEASR